MELSGSLLGLLLDVIINQGSMAEHYVIISDLRKILDIVEYVRYYFQEICLMLNSHIILSLIAMMYLTVRHLHQILWNIM